MLQIKPGYFILENNPLFTYWGKNTTNIDEQALANCFIIGHKRTEIQDVEFSIGKLGDMIVKAVGNDDFHTVKSCLHKMIELLLYIDQHAPKDVYLQDNSNQIRVHYHFIDFKSYLHGELGQIRYQFHDNNALFIELFDVLEKLTKAVSKNQHKSLVEFVEETLKTIESKSFYRYDLEQIKLNIREIAQVCM